METNEKMYYMVHPGETLRRWKDARGYSEGQLAKLSGVKQPTVHRILTGDSKDPRRSNLEQLAKVFGKVVADLYDAKSEPEADSFIELPEDERLARLVAEFARLSEEDAQAVERIVRALNSTPA